MAQRSVIAEKHSMYELIPILENWLMESSYSLTRIANRIDAEKTGTLVKIFLEDYSSGCLIKVFSDDEFFERLREYLSEKNLLYYLIECPYCGKTLEASNKNCPFCGGPIVRHGGTRKAK